MSPQLCDWVPLGPTVVLEGGVGTTDRGRAPVSGRVTALVADPTNPDEHVYVGTALGGVWETRDGGLTWATLPHGDEQASLSIGALALSDGRLYVGTGEANASGDGVPGNGLLIYDVATESFTQDFDANFAGTVISGIVVAPGNRLFVGTNRGLWERVGAGAWTEVPVDGTGVHISDLVYDAAGGFLWIGAYGHGVFVRHPVSGIVLRPRETPNRLPKNGFGNEFGRVSLAQCRQHPTVLYAAFAPSSDGTRPQIFRTSNAPTSVPAGPNPAVPSSTWEQRTAPPAVKELFYTNVLAVHPRVSDTVYFGAVGLFRSNNGGNTWSLCGERTADSPGIHVDQHALIVQDTAAEPGNFNDIRLWAGNDGGVWRSGNGGGTWSHRNRGLNISQYYCLASHPDARSVVFAGAQDTGSHRFSGDGTWSAAGFADGSYVGIDPDNPRIWYGGDQAWTVEGGSRVFLGFQRSVDAGARDSFNPPPGVAASIRTTDSSLFFAPFLVVPPDAGGVGPYIWVGTDRLYLSTDRGDHFAEITTSMLSPGASSTNGISAIAVAPGHPDKAYVGTSDGRFFVVNKPGTTWTTRPLAAAGMSPGSFITAIACARLATGEGRVYVAVGRNHLAGLYGTTAAGLFRNTDSGQKFAAGLFVSDDSGQTFRPVPLPSVILPGIPAPGLAPERNSVNAVVIDPTDTDIAFIGCDIGVFRYSAQAGAEAEPWRQGLPNSPVYWLDVFNGTPRLLRAATHGRGAWETVVDAAPAGGCRAVDTYVRDTIVDDGRTASRAAETDPFTGRTVRPEDCIDILFDVPSSRSTSNVVLSTEDYVPSGQLDDIGFITLGAGVQPHHNDMARVNVRVRNRGPDLATQVKVAAVWADATATVPPLPSNFFSSFPGGPPTASAGWTLLGSTETIARILPGESKIATFSWKLTDVPDRVRVLALVSSNEDPFAGVGGTDSTLSARGSKYIAVRDVDVESACNSTLVIVLIVVGVAVAAGVAVYLLRDEI